LQKLLSKQVSKCLVFVRHASIKDDLFIIYAALYFGFKTKLVTNDYFRDHLYEKPIFCLGVFGNVSNSVLFQDFLPKIQCFLFGLKDQPLDTF
jgi:hypothetical protein